MNAVLNLLKALSEAVFLLPLSIQDQTKFCIQRPFLSALLFKRTILLGISEEYVFFCNHLTSMNKVHFKLFDKVKRPLKLKDTDCYNPYDHHNNSML